jgi:hypothetical protein
MTLNGLLIFALGSLVILNEKSAKIKIILGSAPDVL